MAKNGSNKILITIIVILIITILGASAGAFWYLNKIDTVKTPLKEQNSTNNTLTKIGPFYPLKPFTINLKTANGKYVSLKATLSLELDYKVLSKELDAKNAIIRDKIITILSNQTAEELSSTIGKVKICNKIKRELNSILVDGEIQNVYIVNFDIYQN